MASNIYLAYLIFFVIAIIYWKPLSSILLYTFSFAFINLTHYFPAFDDYRPAFFLALLLLFVCFIKGIQISQPRFVFTLCLLMAVCLITALLSGDVLIIKRAGIKASGRSSLDIFFSFTKNMTLVFLTLWYITSKADLIRALKVFVFGSFCNGAFAIYEQFYHVRERIVPGQYRSWGFQGESNEVGGIMVATIPIALYLYKNATSRLAKVYYLISIVILVFGIFSTVSRTALLCMMLVFAYLLINDKKNLIMLILVGIVMLGFLTFASDRYKERETMKTSLSGKQHLESSASLRVLLWQNALELWLKHPLLGVGLNNMRENVQKDLGVSLKTGCAHNSYLQFLAETGIVGFGIFIYLLYLYYQTASSLKAYGGFYEEFTPYLKAILYSWLLFSFFFSFQFTAVYWLFLSLPFCTMQVVESESAQMKAGIKKQIYYRYTTFSLL